MNVQNTVSKSYFYSFFFVCGFILTQSFIGSGKLGRAFDALEQNNFEKAKLLFQKSLSRYPSGANYGLSLLYSNSLYPKKDLKRSFTHINKSVLVYETLSENKKLKLAEYQINYNVLQKHKYNVLSLLFEESAQKNSIEALKDFTESYQESPFTKKADSLMYILEYNSVLKINTEEAYKDFLKKYPNGLYEEEIRKIYQKKVLENLKGKPLEEYNAFVKKNYGSKIAKIVEKEIFKLSISDGSQDAIKMFIENNRFSPHLTEAWTYIIERNFSNFSETEEYNFVSKFPSVPKDLLKKYRKEYKIKSFPIKFNNKFGLINEEGKELIPCVYDSIWSFKEGRAIVKEKDKFKFINIEGISVTQNLYEEAGDFFFGRAVVKSFGKYGLIDKNGILIIPFVYDKVEQLNKELIAISLNSQWQLFSRSGKLISQESYKSIKRLPNNKILYTKENESGFLDEKGIILQKYPYSKIRILSNGNKIYFHNEKYGLLSKKDSILFEGQYSFIGKEHNNAFLALKDSLVYAFEISGKILFNLPSSMFPKMQENKFENELIVAKKGNYYGVLDKKGKVFLDFEFDSILSTESFPIALQKNGKWGYISKNKLPASAYEYQRGFSFKSGYAIVVKQNGYNIINKTGVEQLNEDKEYIKFIVPGVYIVKQMGKFGIMNSKGEIILDSKFLKIEIHKESSNYLIVHSENSVNYFNLKNNSFLNYKNASTLKDTVGNFN